MLVSKETTGGEFRVYRASIKASIGYTPENVLGCILGSEVTTKAS